MIKKVLVPCETTVGVPGGKVIVRNVGTLADPNLTAQHRAFLAAATSDNTRRTYRSAIRY